MQNWLTTKRFYILFFILFALSIFSALPILELRGEEPRRALVSIEMVLSGNYVVPTLNGECYYNKPPFFNWVLVALFKIFGSFNEWIVRIPSIVSFIFIGIIHFFVTKKYVNKNVALISTIFLYTSVHIFFHSSVHSGEIDLFYSLIVYLQAISLFLFYQRKQFCYMFFLSYLFMAVGFLTKGLTSFVFQGVSIVAMVIYYKDFKLLFKWQNIIGAIGSIFIIVLYFLWYGKYSDPAPYIVKLFTESTDKSSIGANFLSIILSILNFPLLILSKTLPWSILVFLPLIFIRKRKPVEKNKFIQFSLLFIIANIFIYWISPGTRIRYLFMFFPFIYTVIAFYSEQFLLNKYLEKYTGYIIQTLNALFFIIICVAPFLKITRDIIAVRYLSPLLIIIIILNAYFIRKNPQKWILTLAMVLVVAKLEMNLVYWPISYKTDFRYLELIDKAKEVAGDEEIYLTGELRVFTNTISLGGFEIFKSEKGVSMPPFINYKIPYYLTRGKKYIMQYHEVPQKGKYYIADYDFVEENPDVEKIYTYRYRKEEPEYILFRKK